MPPRSWTVTLPVLQTTIAASETAISAIVAYGRVSIRMPGISPRFSFGSDRCFRWRGRRGSSSPRSIFGARLRTRCPQYGHSVTYGLTSDPQFLQTTNRSGCDTQIRGYPRGIGGRGGFGLESRLLDDLCHHFAEIVVGLVDDQLASAAVAAVEDVLDAVEVVGRAQLLGVRADPLQDPLRQLLGRHPCRLSRCASCLVGTRVAFGRSTSSPSRPWRAAMNLFSS